MTDAPYTDAELDSIVARTEWVTLAQCPIGLFLSKDDELCLKTEYGNNEGRIDAYIVSSGEFFWGDEPQTIANQRQQLVQPVTLDVPRLAAELRRAREALRPFVAEFEKHVERYLRRGERAVMQGNYDRMPDRWPIELDMTIGQCRAARAALPTQPTEDHDA